MQVERQEALERWEMSDIAVGILLSGSGSEHSGSVARNHYEEVVPHIRWRVVGTRAQQGRLPDKDAALKAVEVDTLVDCTRQQAAAAAAWSVEVLELAGQHRSSPTDPSAGGFHRIVG